MKNRIINVKGAEVTIAIRHEQEHILLDAIAITQMRSPVDIGEIKRLSGHKTSKGRA
ncbi:hypothetical protein SAMN05216344_10975 [Polaromonas sp. OV174]|uniref:hypothetical protein n=1 Tax=Polaromonas sp. OV174 TaxID=1855300 RepID=UPI0008F099A9|nr:hypothetical protein [Polaromonas sp. OV174]SFC11328.1 hypothetical protein SAMN05216344_10975 [Polaromonas sp. OV174]